MPCSTSLPKSVSLTALALVLLTGLARPRQQHIIFDRLSRSELATIVDLQLNRVRKRLAKQGLGLALTAAAKEFLGSHGYDPVYGARPLKRAIQHCLLDPLSLDVLDGKFIDGDIIQADVEDGAIVFR